MNAWWLGLAPAQATVSCGGNEHRLHWEAGELQALDHGDVEGELALAALGGQRYTCMDMLGAWERHSDDLRVLVLGSRGARDQVVVQQDLSTQLGGAGPQSSPVAGPQVRRARAGFAAIGQVALRPSGWTAYGPSGRASKQAAAENELLALLGLGGGLPARLLAGVAAVWRERLTQPDGAFARVRPQLHAALHGRAFAAIGAWLGQSELRLELKMVRERGEPRIATEHGVVRAELPFGWLVDVWAKDFATIWGRFCLSAASDDGRVWTLTTVSPDLGRPSLVKLELA